MWKICGPFLKFSSVEKYLCFQHGNQCVISQALQVELYFTLRFKTACYEEKMEKIRNQKFSVILEKPKADFLLEAILFLQTKGFQAHTPSHLCQCKRVHV